MQSHSEFRDNQTINEGEDFFKAQKSYFEKNVIEFTNRKKTEFSTYEKIPILGAQYIEIFGFFDGFVL